MTHACRKLLLTLTLITLALVGWLSVGTLTRAEEAKAPAAPPVTQPQTRPVPEIRIDMDKAVAVALPEVREELKPAAFQIKDGKAGWVLKIPGNRPIATPAFAEIDGRGIVFVGGGYGSHEFYAFDARTGEKVWEMKTADDGPTAAVVEDGYVAFNTESCTVIVADARTGKVVWQEWLGDPLMSQPAISRGRLFMAHPAGQHGQGGHAVAPNAAPNLNVIPQAANPPAANVTDVPQAGPPQQLAPQAANAADVPQAQSQPPVTQPAAPGQSAGQAAAAPARHASHRLLCADLKTGKHLWEADLPGDVITAPIIDNDQVYFTCFDGTSFCLDGDGKVVWSKANSGTSAPVVADGQVVITQKQVAAGGQAFEGMRRLDSRGGNETDTVQIARAKADYLTQGNAGNVLLPTTQAAALNAAVGFADAPFAANLASPGGGGQHVNVNNVAEGWAYQGSKAAYGNGRVINAQGNALNCVDWHTGQARWRGLASGKEFGENAQIFAPPALGGKFMYLCSVRGHMLSVSQDNGQPHFIYAFSKPMAFQPALANGRMFAGTTNGMLICLDTGDPDADGWTAWGGNAQHNKKQ